MIGDLISRHITTMIQNHILTYIERLLNFPRQLWNPRAREQFLHRLHWSREEVSSVVEWDWSCCYQSREEEGSNKCSEFHVELFC